MFKKICFFIDFEWTVNFFGFGKSTKNDQHMKLTRNQDRNFQKSKKPRQKLGFISMLLLCQQCAAAFNSHQNAITNRCQHRWKNRLPLDFCRLIIYWFSSQLGIPHRCKMYQKIDLKINSKNDVVLAGFSVALGSVLEAKLAPKSVKNRP